MKHDPKLEALLFRLFEEVKDVYFRPPIGGPELVWEQGIEEELTLRSTAFMNWMNRIVGMNTEYITELAKGFDLEKIARAEFSHEFGHWHLHPYDESMHAYLSYMSHMRFGQNAGTVYQFYTDFCNDILTVYNDLCREEMLERTKAAWANLDKSPVFAAIYLSFKNMFNKAEIKLDLDIDLTQFGSMEEKINTAVEELSKIYVREVDSDVASSYGFQYSQLVSFGEAILPLLPPPQKQGAGKGAGGMSGMQGEGDGESGEGDSEGKGSSDGKGSGKDEKSKKKGKGGGGKGSQQGKGDGSGEGDGSQQHKNHPAGGGNTMLTPDYVKNMSSGDRQKLEGAVKKLVKFFPRQMYEGISEYFFGKDEMEEAKPGGGIGTGSVDAKLADRKTIDFYRTAAEQYGIFVRPKRTLALSKISLPFGRKEFKPSDMPLRLSLLYSGGRILPGLAHIDRMEDIPYPLTKEIMPRLIYYKDGSGSRDDPRTTKDYGTMVGAMWILSYSRSGSEVGVAIFDSNTTEVLYSRDEDELLTVACGYKGGGTYVNMKALKEDLKRDGNFPLPLDRNLNPEEIKRNPFFRKYLEKNAKLTGFNKIRADQMTDFVIETDGGIGNIVELLDFFSKNKQIRPTIIHAGGFDINIPGYDQKTSGIYEGVTIIKAGKMADLINMTHDRMMDTLLSQRYVP